MFPTIIMLAPANNRSFSTSSGNVYTASAIGLITNVVSTQDVNDLQAQGCIIAVPRNNVSATRNPLGTDDFTADYGVGSFWVNVTNNPPALFALSSMSTTPGSANWVALSAGGAALLPYATLALLNADLAHAAGTQAVVYADPTPANDGIYIKLGGTGTGSWQFVLPFGPIAGVILANGTIAFTGNQDMGGFKLTGLGAPTNPNDAVRKAYADLMVRADGTTALTGPWSAGNQVISNLADPVNRQDVASRNYVDQNMMWADYTRIVAGRKLVLIGDSITYSTTVASLPSGGDTYGYATYGGGGIGSEWAWFRRRRSWLDLESWFDYSDPNGNMIRGANNAIAGSTVQQFVAQGSDHRYVEAMKQSPDVVYISLGVNDINGGRTATQIMGDLATACRMFTYFGILVILTTVRPVGTSGIASWPNPDARRTTLITLNQLIRAFAQTPGSSLQSEPNVILDDPFTIYNNGITNQSDPNYTVMLAAYTTDGTHPTDLGAYTASFSKDAALRTSKFPLRTMRPNVRSQNILPGWDMPTSAFSAIPGGGFASGFLPTGFQIQRLTGSGTVTVNPFSPVPGGGNGLFIQTFPNPAEASSSYWIITPPINLASLALGEFVYPYCAALFENVGAAANFYQSMGVFLGSFSEDGFATFYPDHSANDGAPWTFRGPQFKVRSDMTAVNFGFEWLINGMGSAGGTYGYIRIREMGIMKTSNQALGINFPAGGLRGYNILYYNTGGSQFEAIYDSTS